MHWKQILPVLIEVFTRCAVTQVTSPGGVHKPLETPPWSAEWKERSATFVHPLVKARLELQITSVVGVGNDDSRKEELDTGVVAGEAAGLPPEEIVPSGQTDLFETVVGLRRFVVQAQAWVPENTDSWSAHHIIERLRTRMDFDSSRQSLLAVNVDFTDVGASRPMNARKDGKLWSVVSIDFTFTAGINETDPIPLGWIERIVLSSHEQHAPGNEVSASLRMIEETLPPEE